MQWIRLVKLIKLEFISFHLHFYVLLDELRAKKVELMIKVFQTVENFLSIKNGKLWLDIYLYES